MKLFKLWYHFKAAIKIMIYRIFTDGRITFGKKSTFRNNFHAMAEQGGRIKVGNHCFFNNGCSLNALEQVTIGDGTIFGENSHVYDHNHRFRDSDEPIKSQGYAIAPVNIGNHVWIGTNVVILKGVTIGDNAVIGAGCIVEQDIPADSIVSWGGELTIRQQTKS